MKSLVKVLSDGTHFRESDELTIVQKSVEELL